MTELPKLSSSHIHVFTSVRVKDLRKGEGKDGFKRVDNPNARWFRGKGKGKHTGSGKPGASARHANPLPWKITTIMMKTWMNLQTLIYAHNDPVDRGSDDGEEALDYHDDEENDTFSSYVALDDVTVFEAVELDATALLADTWNEKELKAKNECRACGKRSRICNVFQLVYTKSDTYSAYGDTTSSFTNQANQVGACVVENTVTIPIHPHLWLVKTYFYRQNQLNRYP